MTSKSKPTIQNDCLKSFKEYNQLFDSKLDVILLNASIVDIPIDVDALVNCTGPSFEHYGINFEKKKF
jgi:hypothetical protein